MPKQDKEAFLATKEKECPTCGMHDTEWKNEGYQKNGRTFCSEVCAVEFFQI